MREDEFIAALRVELVAAAERRAASIKSAPRAAGRRRRRRLTAVAVAVAAAVSLLVAGVVVVREDDDRQTVDQTEVPPFQVSTDGDDVIIRLTDRPVDPQDLLAATASVGFDLGVLEVPVGPSQVGRIQTVSAGEGVVVENLGSDGFTDGVRLDRSASGHVVFSWGRAAAPGEAWQQWSDALAPGEVLACEPLLGTTVADVEELVADRGLDVRWFTDADTVLPGGPEVDSTAGIEDWKVAGIDASGPAAVVVTASEDGRLQRVSAGCRPRCRPAADRPARPGPGVGDGRPQLSAGHEFSESRRRWWPRWWRPGPRPTAAA